MSESERKKVTANAELENLDFHDKITQAIRVNKLPQIFSESEGLRRPSAIFKQIFSESEGLQQK